MLQTYKTSPESPLELLPNSLSFANFKHKALNFFVSAHCLPSSRGAETKN